MRVWTGTSGAGVCSKATLDVGVITSQLKSCIMKSQRNLVADDLKIEKILETQKLQKNGTEPDLFHGRRD